jgi:hypothetical protein
MRSLVGMGPTLAISAIPLTGPGLDADREMQTLRGLPLNSVTPQQCYWLAPSPERMSVKNSQLSPLKRAIRTDWIG